MSALLMRPEPIPGAAPDAYLPQADKWVAHAYEHLTAANWGAVRIRDRMTATASELRRLALALDLTDRQTVPITPEERQALAARIWQLAQYLEPSMDEPHLTAANVRPCPITPAPYPTEALP